MTQARTCALAVLALFLGGAVAAALVITAVLAVLLVVTVLALRRHQGKPN